MTEVSILYFRSGRAIRTALAEHEIEPAGRRPWEGRGRPPLVYPAEVLVDLMSLLEVA